MDVDFLPPSLVLLALASVGHYSTSREAWAAAPEWVFPYLKHRGVPCPPPPDLDLGYLPVGKTAELVTDFDTAIEAGLAQPSPSGLFYSYDGRLVAGIRDLGGRVRGFYGRAMPGLELAKWVAPGVGHFRRKTRIAGWPAKWPLSPQHILITEGPMDCAAIHVAQAVLPHRTLLALGTCGAPSTHQVGLVGGLAEAWRCKVWLAYDGDEGGRQAAMQWQEHVSKLRQPRPTVVELPEGEDPASFLAKAKLPALIQLMQEAARRATKAT